MNKSEEQLLKELSELLKKRKAADLSSMALSKQIKDKEQEIVKLFTSEDRCGQD